MLPEGDRSQVRNRLHAVLTGRLRCGRLWWFDLSPSAMVEAKTQGCVFGRVVFVVVLNAGTNPRRGAVRTSLLATRRRLP